VAELADARGLGPRGRTALQGSSPCSRTINASPASENDGSGHSSLPNRKGRHVWADCRDLCPLKDGEAGAQPGRKRKRAVTAEEVETLTARIEQAGNREMIDNP